MSILSKRNIVDKPQELKPSSTDRKRKLDELNPHLRREKPKEESIEDVLSKFKKSSLVNGALNNTGSTALNKKNNKNDDDDNDKIDGMDYVTVEDLYEEDGEEEGDDDNNLSLANIEDMLGQDEMLMRPGKDMFTDAIKTMNDPEDLATEYINRLLIDEYQKNIENDEMFHTLITEIPEWNDYNNHVLREVQQLEEEEVAYEGVDNARLTHFWNTERIKTVESIRRQHFPRVESAVHKRFKLVYNDLAQQFDQELQELSIETGLTIDQLKVHKDYSSIFQENHDKDTDELFQTKDDLDLALEKVVGSTDQIPNDFKSIYKSVHKSITDGKSIENNQMDLLFENAAIETKKQSQQQSPQYLYQQQAPLSSTPTSSSTTTPKLNFNDISTKNQKPINKPSSNNYDEEEFDLKSILDNMSK